MPWGCTSNGWARSDGGKLLAEISGWYEQCFKRRIDVDPSSDKRFSVTLESTDATMKQRVNLADTGEGMAQVLPVLVAAAMARRQGPWDPWTLAFEQPELHLHPAVHAPLAEHLCQIAAKSRPPRMLIETHSENFLLGVQLQIAKRALPADRRLVTLFGALYAPLGHGELPARIAYYDLRADDFFFCPADQPLEPAWMPLRYALDINQLIPFQRSLGGLPDAEALIKSADLLSGAFKRYKIPVLPIVTNDLDQVTKTFQRVNSQGTVMSEAPMVAALTWSEQFDLNERIAEWKEQWLAPQGWGELDDKVVLYACKAALGFDVYDADVDAVSRALRRNPEVLEKSASSLVDAASFLRRHCGIRSPRVLPYESHLIPLAEAIRRKPGRHDGADREALVKWFWLLAYSGTRAGLPKLLQALEHMCGASPEPPSIPVRVPSPLPALPRRFDFRSARCKTLALRLAELAGDPGASWLGREGADAMPHFILNKVIVPTKWSPNPANRILVDPQGAELVKSEIISACSAGNARGPEHQAVLVRHVIPVDAAAALAANDWNGFYRRRLHALEELETDFVRRLGLLQSPVEPQPS